MKHKAKYTGIISGIIAIAIYSGCVFADMYAKSAIKGIAFQVVNAAGIPDGIYNGSYEIALVKASV